jgi:exopolysaccharide production protein ExoQ
MIGTQVGADAARGFETVGAHVTSIALSKEPARAWASPIAFGLAVLTILIFSNGWQLFVLGENADPDGSALARAMYLPAYAATAALLAFQPWRSAVAALRTPLLWLIVLTVFASTLWSIDPGLTGRRAVALLFTTLAALALAARYDWPALSEVFAASFGCLALASFLTGLLIPHLGRMTELFPGAWRGVWSEKNALGDHMALGVVIFLAAAALNPKRRWVWLPAAGLALALVVLSTSKTSLVGLAGGLAALGLVWLIRRGPASAVAASLLAVTGLLAIGAAALFASTEILGLLGKDATLTGRTKIWGPVIRQAELRPWTGYGYGAVWDDQTIWGPLAWISKEATFIAREAHDSWLEVWLGLGYIGLGLWSAYFAETWLRMLRALYTSPGAYLAAPFLVIYSLTTITESVVLNYNDFIWVLFAAVAIRLALPSSRISPQTGA